MEQEACKPEFTLSDQEREEVYHRLLHEAPYIPGDEDTVGTVPLSIKEIPWLDPELVKEGQEFVRRNFFAVICAHLGALLFGFSFKRLSTVLLRTGKSHAVTDSMIRYLSTFIHFKTWYETEIGDSKNNNNISQKINSSEADLVFRDVQRIRRMHNFALRMSSVTPLPPTEDFVVTEEKLEVVNALAEDLSIIETQPIPHELLTYSPKVTMSQFDMVMTQFGLVGLIFLFPQTLGVKKDSKGLKGYLHLWAIFGKLLGIQDQFNIALYPDQQLYSRLFTNVGIASLKTTDVRIITLQKSLLEGFGKFTYFGSLKSFLYYGLCSKEALPAYKGTHLYSLLSWVDWFYYIVFKSVLYLYYEFTFFHEVTDVVSKWLVESHQRYYLKTKK